MPKSLVWASVLRHHLGMMGGRKSIAVSVHRDNAVQGGAGGVAVDVEITTELAQARRHAGDSHSGLGRCAKWARGGTVEPLAIVADHQVNVIGDALEANSHLLGRSVAMHIGQGLLRHTQQGSLDLQWQLVRSRADAELHLETSARSNAVGETAQCRSETIYLEVWRMQ